MPLETGKSREAFSKNVATEMKAGKPQKQAVAIAYAQQRRSDDGEEFTAAMLAEPEIRTIALERIAEGISRLAGSLDGLQGRVDAFTKRRT